MSVAAYDLVSFDLDGTLVDTAAEIAEAVNLTLEDHGLPRRPLDEITALIGAGTHALMLKLLVQMGVGPTSALPIGALLQSLDRRYGETAGSSACVYTGARDALKALRAAGVKVACVTNKELALTRSACFPPQAWPSISISSSAATRCQRRSLTPACCARWRQISAAPPLKRCGHVGDSRIDVHAARNAAFAAWAVPYGYNGGEPVASSSPTGSSPTCGRWRTTYSVHDREAGSTVRISVPESLLAVRRPAPGVG